VARSFVVFFQKLVDPDLAGYFGFHPVLHLHGDDLPVVGQ
jgi:hypothetical protein